MKKVFKALKLHNTFSIFIVAALFTACTNNETTETASEARTQVNGFTISASQAYDVNLPTTRAKLDTDGRFFWEKGDKVS